MARNSRSIAMSISVTRSIVPFFSTRMSWPKRAICASPARVTASIAVVRKTGSGASDTSRRRGELLHHAHFHPAFAAAVQGDVVHEAAHEEDAAAARLEQILRRERIGDHLRIESFALIEHAHDQLERRRLRGERELDGHELRGMLAVAVFDRVDDGLANGDANPVHRVFVEAGDLSEA